MFSILKKNNDSNFKNKTYYFRLDKRIKLNFPTSSIQRTINRLLFHKQSVDIL